MVFEFFRSQGDSSLDAIEERIQQMLGDTHTTLDLARRALLDSHAAEDIGRDVRATDRAVNRAERAIRRDLVVHVGVHGGGADIPAVLTYMSIVKDIERIGDYAKNIWDIAAATEGDDFGDFADVFPRVLATVDDVASIYAERDVERATELLRACDAWLDEIDDEVLGLISSDAPSTYGVPRALLHRHIKRVVAHLMNVLTAVAMPFDRLDYFDEDKVDRE